MITVNGSRLTLAISAIVMGVLFVQPRPARAGEGSSPGKVIAAPVI